jgi:hypothetical protein
MTYRTGHPTLPGVISQIERRDNITESPAIENNKRGVRLSKGKGAAGEVIYHIRTRPTTDKRIEWNFAARIAQERALVDKFEKEIDHRCGRKGVGRQLTKSVGAYDKFFNPRLDAGQLIRLEKRAAQVANAGPAPKGLRAEFDENDNLMWVGRLTLSGRSDKLKSEMTNWFKEYFIEQPPDKDSTLAPQFLAESNRADLALSDGVSLLHLRGKERSELEARMLSFVGGDRTAAHNLSALMTQGGIGCAYSTMCRGQGWVTGDPNLPNEDPNANHYTSTVTRGVDGLYHITQTSQRPINVLTINAGNASEEYRFLDEQLSKNTTVLEFTISHDDLAKGKWDSARVVGTPNSRFELHPKLAAD